LVEVIEDQAAASEGDELDALLAKLDSSSSSPANARTKPQADQGNVEIDLGGNAEPTNDLDGLLSELSAQTEAEPQSAPGNDEFEGEDLDGLLEELAGSAEKEAQPPAPAASAPTAKGEKSAAPDNDLDSLLAEIAIPEKAPAAFAPPNPSPAPNAVPEKAPAPTSPPSAQEQEDSNLEDLDALLADLESSTAQPPSAQPQAAQPQAAANDLDDLNALLADMEAPPAVAPQKNDLNSILDGLEAGANALIAAEGQAKPAPPQAPDESRSEEFVLPASDLDAILSGLQQTTNSPIASPPPASSKIESVLGEFLDTIDEGIPEDDNLEALLKNIDKPKPPPTLKAPAPLKSRENALSTIAAMAPNLDPAVVRKIYAATLEQVLKDILPGMVAREVALRIEKEIEVIKTLAAGAER
jgi:hypothetical protein